jgi:hypothetical protein
LPGRGSMGRERPGCREPRRGRFRDTGGPLRGRRYRICPYRALLRQPWDGARAGLSRRCPYRAFLRTPLGRTATVVPKVTSGAAWPHGAAWSSRGRAAWCGLVPGSAGGRFVGTRVPLRGLWHGIGPYWALFRQASSSPDRACRQRAHIGRSSCQRARNRRRCRRSDLKRGRDLPRGPGPVQPGRLPRPNTRPAPTPAATHRPLPDAHLTRPCDLRRAVPLWGISVPRGRSPSTPPGALEGSGAGGASGGSRAPVPPPRDFLHACSSPTPASVGPRLRGPLRAPGRLGHGPPGPDALCPARPGPGTGRGLGGWRRVGQLPARLALRTLPHS